MTVHVKGCSNYIPRIQNTCKYMTYYMFLTSRIHPGCNMNVIKHAIMSPRFPKVEGTSLHAKLRGLHEVYMHVTSRIYFELKVEVISTEIFCNCRN